METQEKELTQEQKIEQLEEQAERHADRANMFQKQFRELLSDEKKGELLEDQEVIGVLENLPPGVSKEFSRDKVLQIPLRSNLQLKANIRKTKRALDYEVLMERKFLGQAKVLKDEIFDEKMKEFLIDLFNTVVNWLESYKDSRHNFYDVLIPKVLEAYALDPKFPQRAIAQGLNKSIAVSLESHFRPDQTVNMEEVVEKILNLSDTYTPGEPLLEKTQISHTWPDDENSFFGFKQK